MAFHYISSSKPHLSKHYFFSKFFRISEPLYFFCSSSSSSPDKPQNDENPDPAAPISTRESQTGMINNGSPGEQNRNPEKIVDEICGMMEHEEWSNSIRNFVPLIDRKLVYILLGRIRNTGRALEFFQWAEGSGLFKHDRDTHCKMIEILCRDRKLEDACRILLDMPEKGIDYDEDLFVLLINGYAKLGRKWDIVKKCVKIFLKMEEFGVQRTIKSYNALLEVIISEKKYSMAEKYYEKMSNEGVVPDKHTYILMISGFCRSSRVDTAKRFFEDMKNRNFLLDFATYNTMINGYAQVKKMEEAKKLLVEMKARNIEPKLTTYNTMVNGYARVQKMEDAEKLVMEMEARGINPTLTTYNTMIRGYIQDQKMEEAQKIGMEMKRRKIEPDLMTYATMIKGYVVVNRVDEGLRLLEEMKRRSFGCKLDGFMKFKVLKEVCDGENMSEAQKNVLQEVDDHIDELELLAMRDSARELVELANRRFVNRPNNVRITEEGC